MNKIVNDGDPWSPVDTSATSVEAIQLDPRPEPPLEIKGGDVTAHINLGGEEPTEEEKTAADEQAADDSDTEDENTSEVEDAEAALAEKLAALDAAKSGKKTKR